MFCTTIIPTIGRPTLTRSVISVLSQGFDPANFEVVVVNDSKGPLLTEDWQNSDNVRVINTHGRERIVARNTGAALGRGRYFHFLDDDDWLLPGALESFDRLARTSDADWLYGGSQLVDRQGNPIIQLKHNLSGNCFVQVMAGEWIPLQSSLIKAKAFFDVGGFKPNILATQDVDLCRRIAYQGQFAETKDLVACIGMGLQDSSTNYRRGPEYSRRAREDILDEPETWSRLQDSAHSPEWSGRIVRIYLTSMIWNLAHNKFWMAASRGMYSLASLTCSGKHFLSSDFWNALFHPYSSSTFLKGFSDANLPVMSR